MIHEIIMNIPLHTMYLGFFFVGYVEERLWWPIQSPDKGTKEKANS